MNIDDVLKEKLEKAATKEEAEQLIKEAAKQKGITLTDEELDTISGGFSHGLARL